MVRRKLFLERNLDVLLTFVIVRLLFIVSQLVIDIYAYFMPRTENSRAPLCDDLRSANV